MRGQQPLYLPFTKMLLFNSYFAHKRNPRNMTSPSFWATFGNFGQVVELEKERIGLQRPIVFNKDVYSLIHGHIPSKCAKCPSSPPNPSPKWRQAPKWWPFSPFKQVVWHVGGEKDPPRFPIGLQRNFIFICSLGPWHPTCGRQTPWKPKMGMFFQNCPPTRSCKEKCIRPPSISRKMHHDK